MRGDFLLRYHVCMEPSSTPPPPPVIVPAITTPSVFETKPGKEKPKSGIRAWVATSTLIVLFIIVVLYFWGAHLAGQA